MGGEDRRRMDGWEVRIEGGVDGWEVRIEGGWMDGR